MTDISSGQIRIPGPLRHIRCWRCWKAFHVVWPTYDGMGIHQIYCCGQCGEMRGVNVDTVEECFWRYIKREYALGHGVGLGNQAVERLFDREFERRWVEACPCGGQFRQYSARKGHICPRCRACSAGWLPWPTDRMELGQDALTLSYVIPAEYRGFDATSPVDLARMIAKPQEDRPKGHNQAQWIDRIWPIPARVLLVVFGVLVLLFQLLQWVVGLVTGTNQYVKRTQRTLK